MQHTREKDDIHPFVWRGTSRQALADSRTGLTGTLLTKQLALPALTGEWKQSVKDAERLFNGNLQEWFKFKGYYEEEKYVTVVRNWHRAADESGLTSKL